MNDPYLWLEDRNGAQATTWAQQQSVVAKNIFESDPRFEPTKNEILNILTDSEKLAMVSFYEGYAYNLWQDDKHQRGIWRRTTITDYKGGHPTWETLLDIDALAAKENQPWVYKSCSRLMGSDHCLLALSKNNQDASEVREYSLTTKDFVKDGFFIPESKSNYEWVDKDHLLVAPTLQPDQLNNSGYPRKVFAWTRGEDLSKAKMIFEAPQTDVMTWVTSMSDQGKRWPIIGRFVNDDFMEFFTVTPDFKTQLVPIPKDAGFSDIFQGKILFTLRGSWQGFAGGSLLSAPVSVLSQPDLRADQVTAVFTPNKHSALEGIESTRDRLYLLVNENVRGQIYEAKEDSRGQWQLDKSYESQNTFYMVASDQSSDTILFSEEGYLQPRQLVLREGTTTTPLKKMKSYFNEAPYTAEQFWVKSKDGIEIPYTVIRAKNLVYDGTNPTLLYGYGGFQISRMPAYSPMMGKEWLEKGGVFVMANIRGGGEFGPEWHKSAMRENKQKSYDDFIAIAEDLIARKITSPKHLGIQGGSNGGLLVGAVTMQRPDLFNAVVCQIPLLDMIRYTKLPPGASWMDEYGDPDDPKFREIILKYSPYQNISPTKKYPKIYFQTTQADDRVHPGHARKMAARMIEQGHDVLFFESTDGGHGGGGVKPDDMARTSAYVYVYLYQQLSK